MTRVAVVGNVGGGKSTLCRHLSQELGLPLLSIDQIQWKPNWKPAPYEEIKIKHNEIVFQNRWIIDGWGPNDLIRERFDLADTIIFIDHPLWVHYWWTIKRQIKTIFRERIDEPEGCPMLPMTWLILKMIWVIHQSSRPWILQEIQKLKVNDKQVIHIRSPRQLRLFKGRM